MGRSLGTTWRAASVHAEQVEEEGTDVELLILLLIIFVIFLVAGWGWRAGSRRRRL